ncbi:peptidoglycan recognition protein [Streptomyces sp. NPDC090306]|uniref:peptidoglycan recognition protein family protein n=1 Tax=Streptomyces sp. NPDC090306 TaxID=3365961 RepID=UPI003830D7C1
MRGFLATSIVVASAAALALPTTLPAAAATASGRGPVAGAATTAEQAAEPGTRSVPLVPLTRDRVLGTAPEQGLPARDVRHFSLLGVVWDSPRTELLGRVQVRTRTAASGAWSGWRDLETHNSEHGADPGTAEGGSARVRGATAPLWVGDSDGVEVRVRAAGADEAAADGEHGDGARPRTAADGTVTLPTGLRLALVDPGRDPSVPRTAPGDPADGTPVEAPPAGAPDTGALPAGALDAATSAASAANSDVAALGATEIGALDRAATEAELLTVRAGQLTDEQRVKPHIGPRPRIVTRRGWGANEKLREKKFGYTKTVKAAFVHHTATGNTYRCSQAPSVIRSIYSYHVKSMGWRDIGYNFVVDKCGTIYEGRAGGVTKPVMGAHTLGFNSNSTGIAVLGTFGSSKPPAAAVRAIARLVAWKIGLYGGNPKGKTYLRSGGGNLYRKGKNVRLNVISGHRDGFLTECPGRQLYGKLGTARSTAAYYQGR